MSQANWKTILYASMLLMLAVPAVAQEAVKQGDWRTIDYEVKGVWRIVRSDATLSVELGEDFETKNGPDLHILLSPEPLDEITNDNASDGALIVGLLKTTDASIFKKMKGPQSLPLPKDVDLSKYQTILVHCVKFSHLWAGAPL